MFTKFTIEYDNPGFMTYSNDDHFIRGPFPLEELEERWNYFYSGIKKNGSDVDLRNYKTRINFKINFT